MIFTAIFTGFQKAALLLGFVVIGVFSAASVQAQTTPVTNPKSEITSSLTDLSNLYKTEVERLEKRNEQSQQLYKDGLISRIDFEKGEKELADARAKVEQIAKEIAAVNQPGQALPEVVSGLVAEGNQIWSTGNAKIDNLIRYYGGQYGVDPFLIYCTMAQESSFTTGATSPKGAQGLMQLMPGTAARYGVTNPYDVAQNIKGGTRYLKDLLKMFNGRVDLALAGYNAGEGAVMKYGNTIPPYSETRNYVRLILKRYSTKKQVS
ncbi:MAG TPA: lytic transglycosylase domain-containing protein [Pyrinomonadaceae bacterium]|nr:lytic transglycosylase domain-containing protein [Pyrinomonadaceae bacterium]